MDLYGNYLYMDLYGYVWIAMGLYGCMDSMDYYGFVWVCMDIVCSISRFSKEFILTLNLLKVGLVKP